MNNKAYSNCINLYIVTSAYHLLIACAEAKANDYLITAFQSNSSIVKEMVNSTFGKNVIVTPDFYYYKKNPQKFIIRFRKDMSNIRQSFKNATVNDIVVFNDVDPMSQWLIKNIGNSGKVILIEEGIGLYRDTVKNHPLLFKLSSKVLFGFYYENINRIGESTAVDIIKCRHANQLNKKQSLGKEILEYKIDESRLFNISNYESPVDGDWFIGQPLVEDGVMDIDDYLEFIEKILIKRKDHTKKLIIKPHPRENVKKYDCFIDNPYLIICNENTLPIEIMLLGNVAKKVFTIFSSAIINISELPNVRSYALFNLTRNNINIPTRLFEMSNIEIPTSWDELKE